MRQRGNTEQWQKRKYKHLECQEGTGHISSITHCVSSFVAPTTWRGCSYVNPPGCQKKRDDSGTGLLKKKSHRLFLQHTSFSWWVDLESLTEGPMMFLPGLNSSCTVVVTVHDENNNPPVFSQHEVQTFRRTLTHTLAQNLILKKQQAQTSQPTFCSQATDPIVFPLSSAL